MSLHVLQDLEQRSKEWHDQRRGIVTASAVGKLITVRKMGALDFECPACGAVSNSPCLSKRGAEPAPIKTLHPERTAVSATVRTTVIEPASNDESRGLTATLAAERISGHTDLMFVNDDMWRGIDEEPLARDLYSQHIAPVTEVGFMVRDFGGFKIGCSPDGLVGDDGGIEIKSRKQKKHLLTVVSDSVPMENMAQIQATLLVSGRQWWDYVSYCGGMKLYVKRVYPDARWQKAITDAVRMFEANAQELAALYTEAVHGMPMAERIEELEMSL